MVDHPGTLSRPAWDNKPPGTVTFFWLVAQAGFGGEHLVVAARVATFLLLVVAAWACCRALARSAPGAGPRTPSAAATAGQTGVVFLATSLGGPKVLATTNEALMLLALLPAAWASLAMSRARTARCAHLWGAAAGAGVAAAALAKPTGLALALLPLAAAPRQAVLAAAAALAVLLAIA